MNSTELVVFSSNSSKIRDNIILFIIHSRNLVIVFKQITFVLIAFHFLTLHLVPPTASADSLTLTCPATTTAGTPCSVLLGLGKYFSLVNVTIVKEALAVPLSKYLLFGRWLVLVSCLHTVPPSAPFQCAS